MDFPTLKKRQKLKEGEEGEEQAKIQRKKNVEQKQKIQHKNSSISPIPESTNSRNLAIHDSGYFDEYIHQALDHYLNQYLIYFKSVEARVNSSLETALVTGSCQNKLEALSSLTKDLRYFIASLEKFYIEEELVIYEIEEKGQFREILNCAARLHTILEKLDDCQISGLLEINMEKKEEHMLCSILGLADEAADFLINLDSNIRNHQTDEYWILSFVDLRGDKLEYNPDMKSSLMKLGFTEAKAQYITTFLNQNSSSDHQTITYWAKRYIEQQFCCHILLSPQRSEFPKNGQLLNKEFTIETNVDEGEESFGVPAVRTEMLDEDMLGSSQLLSDFLSQEGDTLHGTTYWFHGTDHVSARNIMQNGIDLDKGKEGGDFSDGRGFYVTSDYKFAHKWPQKMMKKDSTAVIVFKLTNPDIFQSGGKEFTEACKEWSNAVGFFRNKKDNGWCGHKKANELKRCRYIFGPISKDGKDKAMLNWAPRARDPTVYELCIKDDFVARDFFNYGQNIHRAIFFH